ncbi:MAG: c-type cytochrome [Planctomycetales bacterium]|nr:c-type cytochrome [Planctomycetales bacterium]
MSIYNPLRFRFIVFASCVLLQLVVPSRAWAQTESPQTSDTSITFPPLEFKKWSGEINVPDPVAVSVDEQGRVFATQTRRRKIQDLDIREHRQWIPEDVGLQSVEDKRRFVREKLAIGGDQQEQSQHVNDWNEDGQFDWRDLTVVSECIYRLVDNDHDGTADEMTVFAEDFNSEVTGIAAGVMAYEGNVWATIAPDLWKLRDNDDDGIADQREVTAHGFGLHIAYAGHDMHGLTVGPDGKIYWSIGDKGINATSREGRTFRYSNQGGVMRCNPDGSNFEVFAHGLRNVQELAFNEYGDLFSVDNDADMPGERERFVYIVAEMDAGWRCNYQYRGDNYNPWTDEHLWDIPSADHPAYIVPPLSHYVDGPAGFKFNPGTALSPEYKNFFFLTSAPNGYQYAFRAVPDGDSFRMQDDHLIGSGMAIVGLAFGPDGALYGANWDGGYPLDEIGSIVRIDVTGSDQFPLRREVEQFIAAGYAHRSPSELRSLLRHPDQRIRLGAQFALVQQKEFDVLLATSTDKSLDNPVARCHAIWGLGALGRDGDLRVASVLKELFDDQDYHVRGQAAKTFGELQNVNGIALIPLLTDVEPYVRVLAGLALARHPVREAEELLLSQAESLRTDEHYLRHSISLALSRCADVRQLVAQASHPSVMRRMCCVLALRHLASPAIAEFLKDQNWWIRTETARAIHDDDSIPGALDDLANSLTETSLDNGAPEAFVRRAISANFRLGDSLSSQRLMSFALSPKATLNMRSEAVAVLGNWLSPDVLDRVQGYRRDLTGNRQIDHGTLSAGLSEMLTPGSGLQSEAINASQSLHLMVEPDVLEQLLEPSSQSDSPVQIAALQAARSQHHPQLIELSERALEFGDANLKRAALQILADVAPPHALQHIGKYLAQLQSPNRLSEPAAVYQTCIDLLPVIAKSEPTVVQLLAQLANQLTNDNLAPAVRLEVFEALRQLPELASQKPELPHKFSLSQEGGDATRGSLVFRTHVQAQCVRCHRIGPRGSEIGPELTHIAATRKVDHLWRAIAQPSADIDEKYRSSLVLLSSGQVIKGLKQAETETELLLADSNGNVTTISKDEIESIVEQNVSLMPDMTEILTAREVRDLVAYLQTLR